MKIGFILFVLMGSVSAFAARFTEEETQVLQRVLGSIAPIEKADRIYCTISPRVMCGVEWTDPNGWFSSYRTKWVVYPSLVDVLYAKGDCAAVDGWTNPNPKPVRCLLSNVTCTVDECRAD